MSFEANKIAAAVLVAMILAMVSGILSSKLVTPSLLVKNAYPIAGVATAAPAAAEAKPAGPEPIGPLLAAANAEAGKADTRVCAACHTFDKGQPNRIGPNLYGVIGEDIAAGKGGYDFSAALKTAGAGKTWTPDLLNDWLFKPQEFAKGTKMTFAGMPKAKERADVIAYLNSLSDSPKPLAAAASGQGGAKPPEAGAKPPESGAKPPEASAKPPESGAKPPESGGK
jgi:cytochrome c